MDEKLKHALVQLKDLVDRINEEYKTLEPEPVNRWWYTKVSDVLLVRYGDDPGPKWKTFSASQSVVDAYHNADDHG